MKTVYEAIALFGESTILHMARALVRARELHPVYAVTAHDALAAIQEEVLELGDAIDSEGQERQREEAMDVIVMALRFFVGEVRPSTPKRPDYSSLRDVLRRAYDQASRGKGDERHGSDFPFEDQDSGRITDALGVGYPIGQAMKKSLESYRMPADRAVTELLGAINYLALAVIKLEQEI